MKHNELVEIMYKWILKSGGMSIAFKELHSLAREIPDVIGFNSWESLVIECKVSRQDFLKDQKKPHRNNTDVFKGMGKWRFYACPTGLITKEELPKKWGLIYVSENGKPRMEYDCRIKSCPLEQPYEYNGKQHTHRIIEDSDNIFDIDTVEERRLLFTVIRRLFVKGYVKHIYDKDYKHTSANDLISLNDNPLFESF